ncbi:MAG: hypothetical protein K0S33_922 [Bacteroidetes bacterium]|jgi:hypothetical protein|nr:hypothetical protein [Bacteroidota bacterium]
MIKKTGIVLLILGALIGLGFLREFIFVNTNSILYSKLYNEDYPLHPFFGFFRTKTYTFIYISKWFLTAAFIAAYYILQLLAVKWLLKNSPAKNWLLFFYVFLVILSVITFGIGWLAGSINKGYTFSRVFLGILQSPLPLMFLMPVHYFAKKLNQQN